MVRLGWTKPSTLEVIMKVSELMGILSSYDSNAEVMAITPNIEDDLVIEKVDFLEPGEVYDFPVVLFNLKEVMA